MAYSERHRWCTSKIIETFAPELDSETAQTFTRTDANLQQFNQFLKGEGSGRLFVFYQPVASETEVNANL